MKKLLSLLAVLLLSGMLSAKEIEILCTTQPVLAMTNAVVKGTPGFRTSLLLPPNVGCPHDYALTPRDMKALSEADVVVINGLGMEDFLVSALPKTGRKTLLIDSSKGVRGILNSSCSCEHAKEHAHEDEHVHQHKHAENEHLFAAPSTAEEVIRSISRALSERYPAYAKTFSANAESYGAKLRAIADEYRAFGRKVPASKRVLALQHGIFDYIARDAGFHVGAYLQQHAGQEPSASEIIALVKELRHEKVFVILAEKGYPDKVTRLVSREARIPVATLSAYLSGKDSASPEAFLKQFRDNLKILKDAFAVK